MEKYNVLIIEDDETAREQLAKVIKKEGFEVKTARNGIEGLEVFNEEHPEIVITDLKMPGIDGMEVMHTVKHSSPQVQVILITAFGETDTVISALREGVLDYLKKPIDLDQLSLALGRAKEKIDDYKMVVPYPTLLLAEDDEQSRNRLSRILENENWDIYTAADGEEALNIFKQKKIDIALLDINMPGKDGLETLKMMRRITSDFEAIILTGYGDESNAIQALRDGAINFIKKPIDLDQLILSITKAMEKLVSERTLRYRDRELDLSKEIIAKITVGKEIVVDIRDDNKKQPAMNFAQKLLNALPMSLIVLNSKMEIVYANNNLAGTLKRIPERIDKEFVKELNKAGIKGLPYDSLMTTVNKLFEAPLGTIEKINVSQYAYITLTTITLFDNNKHENVILMAIRGERKQS